MILLNIQDFIYHSSVRTARYRVAVSFVEDASKIPKLKYRWFAGLEHVSYMHKTEIIPFFAEDADDAAIMCEEATMYSVQAMSDMMAKGKLGYYDRVEKACFSAKDSSLYTCDVEMATAHGGWTLVNIKPLQNPNCFQTVT